MKLNCNVAQASLVTSEEVSLENANLVSTSVHVISDIIPDD